jgi:predicted ATPase/transcriptional regulator with XRE-family HTH domain
VTADSAESFADLLRRLRRAAGYTQEELARRARLGARSVSDLERGISTAPRRDTVALLAAALRLDAAARTAFEAAAHAGRADLMARRSMFSTGPPSLPTLPVALIGRDKERREVGALLLGHDQRLVTLTGSPGIGKTSLALQVANDVVRSFPHGVVFVPLDTVVDPELVGAAIAQRVELVDTGARPIRQALADHLRDQRMLLVVDNFEQVLPAAALLGELVVNCPHLSMLVTSRAILNLRGEHELAVPPLALPESGSRLGPERAELFPAVRLFVERARAVQPVFELTDVTAAAVVDVCRRLDGVPLAIELAAARCRLLTPSQLLTRLDQSLGLLVGGAHDLPERQRTLRAAIAWSYDLLDEPARELFRRLSVFAGGWTLEAAEATCGQRNDVLTGLTSLVEKSLVHSRPDVAGGSRFAFLQTLREFGQERLADSGEAQAQRAAHAAYFERLAVEGEVALQGPEQSEWLIRLELEHDNLREALRWARDTAQVEVGLRVAGALWRFWEARGHLAEGNAWLEELLANDDHRGPGVDVMRMRARSDALHAAGTLAMRMGDYARTAAAMRERLAICHRLDDRAGVVVALNGLANSALYQGEYRRAAAVYEEALTLARSHDRARHIAGLLVNLATVANERGEYANAETLCLESLALWRDLRDKANTAGALSNLGEIHLRQGGFASAEECLHECIAIFRELQSPVGSAYAVMWFGEIATRQNEPDRAVDLVRESLEVFRGAGDRRGCAMAQHLLGEAALMLGQYRRARTYLDESMALFLETTDRLGVICVLEGQARHALSQDDRDWAARLFGLAAGMRDRLEIPVWAVDRSLSEKAIAALGPATPIFEAARALMPAAAMRPDPVDVPALLPAEEPASVLSIVATAI